jgi:hypothetical protein
MGILSRGLQGFAQGAGDYMKAELKDEMSERGWLRRQAYLEKQRALVRDEDRAFNIDQANIKMLSEQDREDELALEKEDMRQLNLKEQAEIRKNTRLQNIEDQKDSEQRRHLRDTGVRNSWWGSGSQKNFNAELGNLADREFGKTYDDTEEENLTIKEWRDAKAKYISEVENELLTGDHKTIFDWKQWKNKPETSTPTPQTTIELDSRTGATTQNKDDLKNLKMSESKSRFNANNEIIQLNDIKKLLGFQPKDFEVLSSTLGVSIKDRESLERYIFDLSGKDAEYWKQKINKK